MAEQRVWKKRRSHVLIERQVGTVRNAIQMIEKILNEPIPGTPRMGLVKRDTAGTVQRGRVMYVALPGSGNKSKDVLSRRAQQVLAQINRHRRTTAAALQEALDVNRNVIAGAVHELKQAGFVGTEEFAAAGVGRLQVAAEDRPRRKSTQPKGRK